MEFIKLVPAILAGGFFSLPLLTITDSTTTISWPEKFDRIEVHINVKNGSQSDTPIILKVSVDSSSEKSRIEYKKDGKFEKADKAQEENKADQYKNLGKVARQFIKVQHKLNLIKSHRWHEGQENTKFDELCKTCSSQPQTPNNCSVCMCCQEKNCPTEPLSTSQSCKYQLNKNTLGKFFLNIKNLNSANTSKYISPVRVVMTFTPENGDNKYEKGSFWGSLIYGYVDYRYKKTEKPQSDPTLKDVVAEVPTDSPDDNYFANVPQKFTFKMDNSEDGDLDKILDKLNKNDMKKLMNEKAATNAGSLCGCCQDNSNKIECMINRNYSMSLKDDSAITQFEEKLKNLEGECCSQVKV